MKESVFSKWCNQVWLYIVYLMAIVMTSVLIWNWNVWDDSQKLVCILSIVTPMHIFEENTFPAGFYFMNNLGFGSKEPTVYPQNRCTNMITNLGAEIVLILLTFHASQIMTSAVALVVFFGIGETINHTRSGIKMYFRYRKKGKKTIYGPGLITSWCIMIPMSIYGVKWLMEHSGSLLEILGGIGIFLGIAIFLILIPFAFSVKIKSHVYSFKDKGYFEKYEKDVDRL